MSRTQIARTALAHATSDFPLITANSARKRLTAGYEAEQVNYPAFKKEKQPVTAAFN
jgi:hypothetical protein